VGVDVGVGVAVGVGVRVGVGVAVSAAVAVVVLVEVAVAVNDGTDVSETGGSVGDGSAFRQPMTRAIVRISPAVLSMVTLSYASQRTQLYPSCQQGHVTYCVF
jgi:hypothetical protein